MFLDDGFLRICLTILHKNLKAIFSFSFFLIFLLWFSGLFSISSFWRFFPGRTHPQFCGCQHWFWGSKMSIDQKVVGGGGVWISKEIQSNRGKIPLLNHLKIGIFIPGCTPSVSAFRKTVAPERLSFNRSRSEDVNEKKRIFLYYFLFPLW